MITATEIKLQMTDPLKPSWTTASEDDHQRDRLINFWLSAPEDQLEFLWFSPIGELSRKLVRSLDKNHSFTDQQIELRSLIGSELATRGLSTPSSWRLMLANFLLSPPGLIVVNNISSYFPSWLVNAYNELYSSAIPSQKQEEPDESVNQTSIPKPPSPDFGPFPDSLQALATNRLHLNRLLGLSNLFYIDPDDNEIKVELLQARNQFAKLIFSTPDESLESLWKSDIGDRYWAVVRSGIQAQPLDDLSSQIKASAVKVLDPAQGGGFQSPGALSAFLVAMLYFAPGTMQVPEAQSKLPGWLFQPYNEIFALAIPQQ